MCKYPIMKYLTDCVDYGYIKKINIISFSDKEVCLNLIVSSKDERAVMLMIEANMITNKEYRVVKFMENKDKIFIQDITGTAYKITIKNERNVKK